MKPRPRTGIIWRFTQQEFITLVQSHNSYAGIIKELGIRLTGGNYKSLQERIHIDGIDVSHITQSTAKFSQIRSKTAIPLEHILIEHSTYRDGRRLKLKLIQAGLVEDRCDICGLLPEWNGMALVLQLDHINGNHADNRLDNLRIVCPNCHTQTQTYSGRNNKHPKRPDNTCIDCNTCINRYSTRCTPCQHKRMIGKNTKIAWPPDEELIAMLSNATYEHAARTLGVSSNAIRKHVKTRQLF